jgi:predicted amidohydrolase
MYENAHGKTVKVAACQVPDLREDVEGAISSIKAFSAKAEAQGIQLLCFPECFLQGYLLEKEKALRYALDLSSLAFKRLLERLPCTGPVLVIGLIEIEHGQLFNTAIVISRGQFIGSYRKAHLLGGENIFCAGTSCPVFEVDGLKFGINICYDTNFPEAARAIARQGAHLIVCPANNMMGHEKAEAYKSIHNAVRAERTKETGLWLISSDVTGVRDNRVSYGPTAVIDPHGCVAAQVPLMEVGMVSADIPL